MPYQSNNNSISRLLLQRGDAAAQAEADAGAAWGRGFDTIGQIAGRTISDLGRIRADRQQLEADAPRRELEAMQLREKRRGIEGQWLKRSLVPKFTDPQTSRTDHRGLIAELNASGYPDLATEHEQFWKKEQDDTLTGMQQRVDKQKGIFGKSAQFLQEFERDPTTYPQLRPQLLELAAAVHPSLAEQIPEAYDPARVKAMTRFVQDASSQSETMAKALRDLKAARVEAVDTVKANDLFRSSVAKELSIAKSPEEWAAVGRFADSQGVPDAIVKEFGDWSDDAPKRAAMTLLTPEQVVKANAPEEIVSGTSEEANTYRVLEAELREKMGRPLTSKDRGDIWRRARSITAGAKTGGIDKAEKARMVSAILANPQIWGTMTDSVKGSLTADLHAQGFKFPRNTTAGVEQWRQNRILEINKDYRDSQANILRPGTPNPNRITEDERDTDLRRIEDSSRIQTGDDPTTDEQWQAHLNARRRPAPPTPAGSPAPLGTGPAPNTGGPKRTTDIHLQAGDVPADIATMLQTQKPGRYTLDDGTSWRKAEDGTITQIR